MSFSIQRETSDGTLSTLDLTIEYIDQADVHAYVNDIEIDLTGGSTPYTWEWITPAQIKITPDVPNGLVAMVKRSTPMEAMYHNFDAGAVFKDETVDENFKQVLFLSQEAKEGSGVSDIYSDVNMHGYVIGNHGAAVLDGDLVTFGQYRNDALGAGFNRVAAEAARDVAVAAKDTAVASASSAGVSATNANASAVLAADAAADAVAAKVIAEDAATAAAGSLEEFTDTYLGSKVSDPTVDNNGDPLIEGALYWNSVAKEMRSFDGTIWVVAYNTGGVTTFNSRTGTVLPEAGDYSADQVTYGAGSVKDILDAVVTDVVAGVGVGVTRTGSEVTVSMLAGVPLFSVMWWSQRSAIPAGYVAADGQTLSRATYPDAWAGILAGNVPVVAEALWQSSPTSRGRYTEGSGGAVNFRLPDYNGKSVGSLGALFLRGDGALSAETAGAIQRDAMQPITGNIDIGAGVGGKRAAGTLTGAFTDGVARTLIASASGGAGSDVSFDSALVVRTADETRPLNVTGCWVIKLFGAVVNVGSADAAQLATDYANLASRVTVLEGIGKPFTEDYVSPEQTITAAGALSLTHLLSSTPKLVSATLVCKNAVLGYSVGDIVQVPLWAQDSGSGYGMSLSWDSTNINIKYSTLAAVFFINRKDTGATSVISVADWRVVVRAWA